MSELLRWRKSEGYSAYKAANEDNLSAPAIYDIENNLWPQAKPMTESAFYELMEAVLALPEARKILDAHLPKADGDP